MAAINLSSYGTVLIVAALIAIVLFRRILRNKRGTKYSVRSIFITPIIYVALTLFFLLGLPVLWDAIVLAMIVVGVGAGLVLGKRSELFEKDGHVLYKRSMEVMIIWVIGFIVRIGVDFFYNPAFAGNFSLSALAAYSTNPIVLGADIILAFSAGLLLGEAIVLYRNYNAKYSGRKGR